MCTTRGERRLISIRCQKECLENKLDGQTDLHSDYNTPAGDIKHLYTVVIDFIVGSFLHLKFSQQH